MIYGYARVSTKGQDKYGNSLTDQESKLKEAGCEVIYHDSFTGTKMDRPEFNKLMNVLQSGDTLIVTKLDRFARTAADGAKAIQDLTSRGIIVNVLNMGRADNSPMGKLMVTMLLAFAEFERDMIVERTQTGKAVAKQDPNWKDGRKPCKIDGNLFDLLRERCKRGEITVKESCEQLGISMSTWFRKCREASV